MALSGEHQHIEGEEEEQEANQDMDPVQPSSEVSQRAHKARAVREDAEQELFELQNDKEKANRDSLREALHTIIQEAKFNKYKCRLTTEAAVQQNKQIGEWNGCHNKEDGQRRQRNSQQHIIEVGTEQRQENHKLAKNKQLECEVQDRQLVRIEEHEGLNQQVVCSITKTHRRVDQTYNQLHAGSI